MAYMSQANKAKLAVEIKAAMPAGWKYSLAVNHHSTLVLTISEAPVDLIAENKQAKVQYGSRPQSINLNEYYIDREYSGELLKIFNNLKAAMMVGNWDKSQPQSDYFDVGWYIDIKIGKFDRPFVFNASAQPERGLTYEELKARVAKLEAKLARTVRTQ